MSFGFGPDAYVVKGEEVILLEVGPGDVIQYFTGGVVTNPDDGQIDWVVPHDSKLIRVVRKVKEDR